MWYGMEYDDDMIWCIILYGGTIICTVYTLWNIEGDNIFIVSIDLNGCHFNPCYHPNALTVYLIRHKEWNRKQNYVSPHTLVDEKGSGEGSRGHAPDTTLSLSLSLFVSLFVSWFCVWSFVFLSLCVHHQPTPSSSSSSLFNTILFSFSLPLPIPLPTNQPNLPHFVYVGHLPLINMAHHPLPLITDIIYYLEIIIIVIYIHSFILCIGFKNK